LAPLLAAKASFSHQAPVSLHGARNALFDDWQAAILVIVAIAGIVGNLVAHPSAV